jgi:hypothetical protein
VTQAAARATPGPTVLIVSRLSSPSQLDIEGDFYFGHLTQLLRQRGANPVLVLVDHLPNDQARRQCATHPEAANGLILSLTVPIITEARIWLHCALAAWRLRQAAHNTRQASDADVALLASRHALLGGTAENLRLHVAVSQLCQQLQPDIVITTYEGTASERIIWHAARFAGRRPLCVGYQHTRLLQRAHAILRPVAVPGIACDPDAVLTLGEITHAALAASPELSGARLIKYGSHRRSQNVARVPVAERARQCLVIPDADAAECARLFEFAVECARLSPAITFVLRPHPIVQFTELQIRHPILRELPGNVSVSIGSSLEQDCRQSRYCLYRGSSAVFHAVLCGVKPFYLRQAGELPLDPLFALDAWRESVVSAEELAGCIDAAEAAPDSAAAQRAWNFCDRYVSQVRPEALNELLDQLIVPRRSGLIVATSAPSR